MNNDPSNSHVDWYRRWSKSQGKNVDNYTNEELTNFLGQQYERNGFSNDEISSSYGSDFSNAYLDIKNRPDPNQGYLDEFSSGIKSASYGLASTGVGALGLGAGALGLDGVEESLMGKAADLSEKAGQDKPTIERASDVRWSNPAEVARFLAGGMGEATPSVVESAGAYLAGGGIGYGIAKQQAKKAISKTIGERVEGSAADAVEALMRETIKVNARKGFATGSLSATAVSSIGLGQGEIYTSLYENTKLDPDDKDYIDPTRAKSIAVTFGAASGGLDFIGAATLLGKLTGAPKEVAKKYYKRLLLGLPEGVFLEGGTEATQEFINIAAEKFGRGQELEFDGQELSRLFDAGVLGAVGGAQFTTIGAIRGPKDTTDNDVDTDAPVSEDPTTFKQKNLLEDIQEKRGKDARFQPGDTVQIALGGKGVVDRVVGDSAVVKMEDGTLKTNVPIASLSSPIEQDDQVVSITEDSDDEKSNTNTYVTPSGKTVPKPTASVPVIDITINGKKVEKVNEKAGRDAELLFKKMEALAKIDGVDGMSQNTARANKTGGFASNSREQIKLALGEDAGLYRPETKAILRKAGVLNSSHEWILGTKLDNDFDLKEAERVKKERLEQANKTDWIEVNNNVEIKRSGGKVGVIKEITSEGMIAVQDASGQITEYEPNQLKPKATPKVKPKVNKELSDLWNERQSDDFWGTSSVTQESEEVLTEPEFLFTKEKDEETGQVTFVAKDNFEFNKDTKVKLLWTTGKNKKQSKEVSANSVEELSNSVRDFMKAKLKTQHGEKFASTFYGVEINGKTYNASIEKGFYDIAGLEIDSSQRQELDAQKGDISFPISSIEIDEESGELGKGIDSESRAQGNTLKENMTRDASTLVTLVLRQRNNNDNKYPHDSIRVVTARLGRSGNLTVIKAYNSDSGKYIRINGTPGKNTTSDTFNNGRGSYYEIIGKITSTSKVGDVDLFFENIEEFLGNEKISKALENEEVREETAKETKLSKEAKSAQEELEKLEAERDELDSLIEESSKPTDEDLQSASDTVESEDNDGFIEGDWGDSDETKSTSRAKDYLFFVDFSSTEKVLETIPPMTAPEGESEAMRLRSLVSAFGLEWTGGSTVKKKGSADPKKIASAMRTIFSEIIRGEVSTLRKGNNAIRPEHIQSFAAVYMENFEAGKDKVPTSEFPRKTHKFLKQIAEMQSPDQQIQEVAQGIANERVRGLSDKRRELSQKITKQKEVVKSYFETTISEKDLNELVEFRTRLAEQVDKGEITADEADKAYNDKYTRVMPLSAQKQPGQKNTLGGNALEMINNDQRDEKEDFVDQALEDAIEGGDSSEVQVKAGKDSVATGTTIETDELGNKVEVQAEDKGDLSDLESEGAIRFQDMSLEDMVSLVLSIKNKARFLKVLESHITEKRERAMDGRHADVVDNFIAYLYESNVGNAFKAERVGSSEFITDFSQITDEKKLPMRQKMQEVLEFASDQELISEKGTEVIRKRSISLAQEALAGNAEPFQIFEHVLNAIGHHAKSEGYKRFFRLMNDFAVVPVTNAKSLQIEDILPLLDPDGLYDQEELLDALNEVYESDLKFEESSGELLLRDHLRKLVNSSYIVTQESASALTQFQANRFDNDGLEDGKLNSGQQRIDNLVDPTTGEVTKDQVVVVSEATNTESIQNARSAKQSYMSGPDNPLGSHPDLVQEGRSAMEEFAPMGMDIPFALTTALNQIKNSKLGTIANVARLLDNSVLQDFTVEFMSWDNFRKYASPEKGILNKAVILHEEKRIIISEAFNNSYKHSAKDMLAADILHEAVHAVTRPALDLGFAYSSGRQDLINDMIEQHGLPEKYNMNAEALGKVWNDISNTLLPYLREKGKSLDNFYGLSSIDEFFSELASDSKFQQFLANTELPKSMRPPKSKLRTVLDYIFNLLARLGFNTARTPDALTYARGELAKLTEIANQSTELSEEIAAANLRNISTLAATFKKTDINLDYYDLLERISQETARDGTGGTLEDAASHLRGSTSAREDDTGSKIISSERKREQDAEVLKYAEENGLLINNKEFQEKHKKYYEKQYGIGKFPDRDGLAGGSESDIYVDEESQRVFKRNTLSIHGGDTVAYLNRLIIHNLLFPTTAYKLEGFVSRDTANADLTEVYQSVNVVVSQPYIKGVEVTQSEIAKHIASLGILKQGSPYVTAGIGNDINLSDLRADNAIKDADGNIHIIDPIIEQESSMVKILETKLDKLDDPDDILDTIYDLYDIPGYVPDDYIRELKESTEDELGITGEQSGMKALMDAIMGGREAENERMSQKVDEDNYFGERMPASAWDTTVQGNQFQNPTSNDSPRPANARPDDNALVMAEANAAGFNELIKELVKVHRVYGEELGMELDEFLETYGRPGTTRIADIKQLLDKELAQHDKSTDGITLDNAGLNKIARSWGVRKAIMNLEKVRERARKEGSRSTILVEGIEQDVVDSRNIYADLLQGKFPTRDKLSARVKSRLSNTKLEILEEYVKALPNSGFSQENLNNIRNMSEEQLMGVLDAVVDAVDQRGNGEIELNSKEEFNKLLETLTDDRLKVIQGDNLNKKALRYAVLRTIRESKDVMAILRLSKGKIGTTEEKFKDAATAIAKAKSKEEIDRVDIKFPGTLSTPLKHFATLKERELESMAKLQREKARREVNSKINSMLENRSIRLRMALGELQPVNIYDGVTLITMKKVNGEWERSNYKVEIKNGKFMDRDGFTKANKDTLMFVRDPDMIKKHGHEPWFEIMREQALMALTEPIMEEQFHIQRAAWYAGLQGLTERFAKLGYEGKKLSQMSTATVATYRNYASQSQAYAKQFNASLHRVMSKLKLGGNEVYTGLYQDIFWWFDNHPEYAGKEEEGFKQLWKHLKSNANIPDRSLLDDDARRLIIDMVNKALTARDWEAEVNKRLNNRIRDEDVQVESFVNGEMVDLYRLPMDMGYATLPRSLNNGYIRDTYALMKKANWHGDEVKGLLDEARQLKTPEGMEDIYKALFNDQIVERFVKPYTNSDVRQSIFRGPKDSEGDMLPMGNSFVATAFERSGGDMYAMAEYIFNQLSENTSESARVQWQYAFLNQFFKRFRELEGTAKKISNQVDGMQSGDSMRNTPQSLDARGVDNRLPKEFFSYNMYDEVSSNIRLALMSATSHFGRNGDTANAAFRDSKQTLGEAAETFNAIMAEATNSDHNKPQHHYSRSVKRKAYDIMRRRGSTNAEKEWNELYSKSIARGEMDVAFDHLGKYYGKGNVAGPYQDANLLMDILGVQSMSVLNNPKSSFFQALSLFEYPNAFRGLNKIAGKATVSALGNFVDQTFGGMLEAMGVELDKTSRYAQYLNETHFNLKEMQLPFSEYNSMIGSGGDLAESIKNHPQLGMKKYIRYIKNLSTHHKQYRKDGTRAPIDPLSLITGIFPYVNNVVNHSVGVGAIHTYSDLVLQASKVIQERGLTEYTELSAKDLGMGNKMGEWIIGEEDGYIRANEMLINSGAPSVSRLAFDYLDRKKTDKQALPIDERMGLLINQAAMNNVSGEGFNSKPSALYTNDFLKYFSTFLGWPLGKMSRDLDQIFRDPSDRIGTMRALMKYIGMMSAVYVPTGLSFAMLIDWYDEEMLEKPNNLPPISPWAALPVIGPFIAADDPNFTVYAITSRMAKAGVPFGMGMDLANGLFAKGDPFGAAREISLDSRIFAWSMFKNIYDAMGTWATAGEFDWQMVGRPIAYGVGGNSVIQMMDLTSALFDIDSEERRVANYIGMRNHIKKTAFLMGLPLRPPRKGGGVQTGVSINTRQMARAAFAGDSESFLANYQEALDAAKIYLDERGRDDEPAKYVADAFKDRAIQGNITQGTMKDADWQNLLNILDPEVRDQIQQAIASHEHYLRLIGGTPRVSREKSNRARLEEARRSSALMYIQ